MRNTVPEEKATRETRALELEESPRLGDELEVISNEAMQKVKLWYERKWGDGDEKGGTN